MSDEDDRKLIRQSLVAAVNTRLEILSAESTID